MASATPADVFGAKARKASTSTAAMRATMTAMKIGVLLRGLASVSVIVRS
ncbi:hypothetical protein ACFPRL_26905 [Pseudoclavibacter helvolus]